MTLDELQRAITDQIAQAKSLNRERHLPLSRDPEPELIQVFMSPGENAAPIKIEGGIFATGKGGELTLLLTPLKLDQVGGF